MHKTASSASLVLEICHQFTIPFLNQFSSIFGGNCIKTFQNPKTMSVQFQIKIHLNFIQNSFQFKINIQNYISKVFSIHFKNQIKMSENIELSYVWDHTLSNILLHDLNSKIGNMIKEWVVFNKLEDINSLLK